MSENPLKQILGDLLPYFEALEAQSSAILQLLRDKQIADEEELGRYMEQARDASSVKWRAARVRMERVLAVSADATNEPKTKTVTGKEGKQANGASAVKPQGTETHTPASSAKVTDQPSGEQEQFTSEETKNERPNDAAAEAQTSTKSDSGAVEALRPDKKAEKAEKDAA